MANTGSEVDLSREGRRILATGAAQVAGHATALRLARLRCSSIFADPEGRYEVAAAWDGEAEANTVSVADGEFTVTSVRGCAAKLQLGGAITGAELIHRCEHDAETDVVPVEVTTHQLAISILVREALTARRAQGSGYPMPDWAAHVAGWSVPANSGQHLR